LSRVLVLYFSSAGMTKKMAEYIAEGVRFSGQEAVVRNMGDIKAAEIAGYDGYLFGSPTYSQDVPQPVKGFLATAPRAELEGKPGGAFGPYRHDVGYQHDNYAAAIIFQALQDHGMNPFALGPFNLREDMVITREGIKACQDYGRVFGEKLAG
jgi:flavodoxin